MPTVAANNARYIAWLGENLLLAGSIFDAAGHTLFNLNDTTGGLTSWKNGRDINSLPNATIVKSGTYFLRTGSAALILPAYVAGAGGTIDYSIVAPASPSPNPNPNPNPQPTTTLFSDFDAVLTIPGAANQISQISDATSGITFSGYGGDKFGFDQTTASDVSPADMSFTLAGAETGLVTFPGKFLGKQFIYRRASTGRVYNGTANAFVNATVDLATLTSSVGTG